jgi:DNA replicative helicase MCM subunit Mcm2 (Cdc46/Mcm family)
VLAAYSDLHARDVLDMARRNTVFEDLARSICPSVYGCEAVKKAVLLMLMGGVHKVTPEVRAACCVLRAACEDARPCQGCRCSSGVL